MATTKRSTRKPARTSAQRAKKTARRVTKTARKRATKTAKRATSAVKRSTGTRTAAKRSATKRAPSKRASASRSSSSSTSRPASRSRNGSSGADAITELKQDHRRVEELFRRFQKAGDGAGRTKRSLVSSMVTELSRHAGIEELVFYPAVREEVPRASDDVLESLEEHHLVKLALSELEGLSPSNERFDAKVTVLIEMVRHHVREEEQELFPVVKQRLGRPRLRELGDELRAARTTVPTRPHPATPDEPPANTVLGPAVAVIDRAREVGQRVVDRVM